MSYISDSDLTKFSIQLFSAMGASDDDAKIAASKLGIALTKRGMLNNKEIPMCGVPVHSSQTYLSRLIKFGFI